MNSRKLFVLVALVGLSLASPSSLCAKNWNIVPFQPPDGLTIEEVAHIVGKRVVEYTARNVSVLRGHPRVVRRMRDGQIWIGDKDGRIVSCRLTTSALAGGTKQLKWSVVKDVLNHTPHKELQYSWRFAKTKSAEEVPRLAFAPEVTFTSRPRVAGVERSQVRSPDRNRNTDPSPAEIQVVAVAPVWQRAEFIAPLFFLICLVGLIGIKAYRSHQEVRQQGPRSRAHRSDPGRRSRVRRQRRSARPGS